MSLEAPKVTVLMPVYNGERFLREAIDSVLSQTMADFELLIINDGSRDASVSIIESYHDPRIRLVHNEGNLKLIATLNRGLELARGQYIARLDADDVSMPDRLEKQVAYLDAHPEVGLCGTWACTIGEEPGHLIDPPSDRDAIRCRLLYSNAFVHSSIMLRQRLFDAHALRYDVGYLHAEDFQLWQRASGVFPVVNLPEVLVHYRIVSDGICRTHGDVQMETLRRIDTEALQRFGITPSADELLLHRCLDNWLLEMNLGTLDRLEAWLLKLKRQNDEQGYLPQQAFRLLLRHLWFTSCHRVAASGAWTLGRYSRSSLTDCMPLEVKHISVIGARWLLFHAWHRARGLKHAILGQKVGTLG